MKQSYKDLEGETSLGFSVWLVGLGFVFFFYLLNSFSWNRKVPQFHLH